MLYHHDQRDYATAATEAARRARAKLEGLIAKGRERAAQVIQAVETQQPVDRLVRGNTIRFEPTANSVAIAVGDGEQPLHTHALNQAAKRVGLPWGYARHLLDPERRPWGRALLAHNLNELFNAQIDGSRFLLRAVHGEVRGFLSDRFRRLDSLPIVEAFAHACQQVSAVPVEGYVTDTKTAIKAVLPQVFEPVEHEVMAFGVVLENSDFGNGALSLRVFCLRLFCTNYAIADQCIREVHLGSRLADDVNWSDTTYELDARRTASAVGDVVKGQLAPARIAAFQATIREANDAKLDSRQVVPQLRRTLTKAETDDVVAAFNSPEVELLPPGNTTWRLSNAVSWVAGQLGDSERKLELMKVAGALLSKPT